MATSSKALLFCKRCRHPYYATVKTMAPDPDGTILEQLKQAVKDVHLCPDCDKQRAWYASQGRVEDWEAGRP